MARTGVCLGLVFIVTLCSTIVDSTKIKNCKGQRMGKMLSVDISACEAAPCLLKRNTTTSVEIKFIPQNDIKELRNRVFARLAGLPVPFLGVDGKLSCSNVFQADGVSKAGCPLAADTEYVYKNSFDILPIYPTVNPLVHWALQDGTDNSDVVCFEIQSKIVQ